MNLIEGGLRFCFGREPLQYLVDRNGNAETVRYLLDLQTASDHPLEFREEGIATHNEWLATNLIYPAAQNGNALFVRWLIEKGAKLKTLPPAQPPLFETYRSADHPPLFATYRTTPLILAAKGWGTCDAPKKKVTYTWITTPAPSGANYYETILLLHSAGADVNAKDFYGRTALANVAPNLSMIKLLLLLGADPSLRDKEGRSGFDHISWSCDHDSSIRNIIEKNWPDLFI